MLIRSIELNFVKVFCALAVYKPCIRTNATVPYCRTLDSPLASANIFCSCLST